MLRFFEKTNQWIESATSKITTLIKSPWYRDGIIDLIEQSLTDRRQRVVVDGEVSNWKSV